VHSMVELSSKKFDQIVKSRPVYLVTMLHENRFTIDTYICNNGFTIKKTVSMVSHLYGRPLTNRTSSTFSCNRFNTPTELCQ
jgi:hypothetical protein